MNECLPPPGPPFKVGELVAFFPAEVASPNDPGWLRWDYAVIDDINEGAESFGFHFVSEPGVRHGQGLENIVRKGAAYDLWRAAFERAQAAGVDPDEDETIRDLWLRVLAEHPIHGGSKDPHPAVADRRSYDIPRR